MDKLLLIKNKIIKLIGLLTFIYLYFVVFLIEIPKYIVNIWDNSSVLFFLLKICIYLICFFCLFSVFLNESVKEISQKNRKLILNILSGFLISIIVGVYNYGNYSLIVALFLAFFFLFFYISIDIQLSKITDFSYAKGWFDGYKNNINDYGKTYDEGFEEGKKFKIQEQNKSLVFEEYPLENEDRTPKNRLEVLKSMAFRSFKEKQKKDNSSK